MVTTREFSERCEADELLLRALVISLVIHLLGFGMWKWGQSTGWFKPTHFPSWMRLAPSMLKPMTAKKMPLMPKPPPPKVQELVFVDVDPALAETAPPKTPKYYSANNTVAANPHPNNKAQPEIDGRQSKVIKTTENSRPTPQPLRPSPAPKEKTERAPETKPIPQKSYTPGDMAMAKPREKPQEKDGKAETLAGEEAQPQPQVQPTHDRPRTLAEAMARSGMSGEKSRQDGGVDRPNIATTLDTVRTSYGAYDARFIDAVRQHWYQLLGDRSPGPGKVVVEFRMLPDGRIVDLKMLQSEVSELYGVFCEQALREPAPYGPWPLEMQRDFPQGYRDVTFTFIYE
jgi:outer membrane biosynthesis protein TonB